VAIGPLVVLPPIPPGSLVVAEVEEGNHSGGEGCDVALLVERDADGPPADVRGELVLPHERVLVLRTSGQDAVDFAGVEVPHLVVVADEQDVRLLPALVRLHDLLGGVRHGVGGASAGMDEAHHRGAFRALELDVLLHVADELHVRSTAVLGHQLHEEADVDALVLDVPAFVVVAGDELRRDAGTCGPVANEVVHLALHGEGVDVRLRVAFALDHVAELVHRLDALGRPDVEQGVEDIHPLILRAEMVVGGETELDDRFLHVRDVDDARLVVGQKLLRQLHGVVEDGEVGPARLEPFDGHDDLRDPYVQLGRQGFDSPRLPALAEHFADGGGHRVHRVLRRVRSVRVAIPDPSGETQLAPELPDVFGSAVELLGDLLVVPHLTRFRGMELDVGTHLVGGCHWFLPYPIFWW